MWGKYDHKVNTGCFWYKSLNNTFTQKLGPEAQIESSGDKSDTKDDRTTNTNIKEVGNDGNVQVDDPDVETVYLPGDDAPQGFVF